MQHEPYNRCWCPNRSPQYNYLWNLFLLIAIVMAPANTQAQVESESGNKRILALVQQLESNSLAARNQSERLLLEMGAPFEAWIETNQHGLALSSESRFRIVRILDSIFEDKVQNHLKPTTISVANLDLNALADNIREQTGNVVSISKDAANIPADMESITFWELVDLLCEGNDLAIDDGPNSQKRFALIDESKAQSQSNSTRSLHVNSGVLRVEWLQNSKDSGSPQARLGFFWEPRLRVLDLRIPMESVEFRGIEEQPWATFNRQAMISRPPRPDRNRIHIRLPVRVSEGQPANPTEASLKVDLVALAPDIACVFKDVFRPGRSYNNDIFQSGMASVSLKTLQTQKNQLTKSVEQLRVQIQTEYESQLMAQPVQSHQDWSQFTSAQLEFANGKVVLPTSTLQIRQEPWAYTIEFKFENLNDIDGAANLRFRIPSGIVSTTEVVRINAGGN